MKTKCLLYLLTGAFLLGLSTPAEARIQGLWEWAIPQRKKPAPQHNVRYYGGIMIITKNKDPKIEKAKAKEKERQRRQAEKEKQKETKKKADQYDALLRALQAVSQ